MSNPSNIEPFKKLVRCTSRAFYGDIGVNPKTNQLFSFADVLNTLTRYEWVRERELEKALRVRRGELLQTLLFLRKEKLVKCGQKKEPVEVVRRLHAGDRADAQHDGRGGDVKTVPMFCTFVHYTYWCLDYGQIYNVARYKIFCLKKQLKDELDTKNRMQEYSCPKCNKRYTALNASILFSDDGENLLSDNFHGQLVAESDKSVALAEVNADNNVKCCEKLEEMLQKMEEQVMPLAKQLNRVKELAVPDFGTLEAREIETETFCIDQGKIGPLSSVIEQMKNLMKLISSSNKRSKMDVTSKMEATYQFINSSQDYRLLLCCHASRFEVQWGQNTKKQQDPSNVHISGQPTSSDYLEFVKNLYRLNYLYTIMSEYGVDLGNGEIGQGLYPSDMAQPTSSDHHHQQPGMNPLTTSYVWPSGNNQGNIPHLLRFAAGLEVQQEQDSKKQHDQSNVDILGLPTTLDCQVGMKRKHEVKNIREVATPSGITEEFCKLDLHVQTGDDNDDGWELVEHDLVLQR